ncbi:hypothetical protein UlMin_013188 [Ulmus minor]
MKHAKKKKRSSGAQRQAAEKKDKEEKVVQALTEAFSSVSLEEALSEYREANGDQEKAVEILGRVSSENSDDPSAGSSSGGASTWGSSEGSVETSCVDNLVNERDFRGSRKKKVVAATGTVSTVMGKGYMMSTPRGDSRASRTKLNGFGNGLAGQEEKEQFLCSMLGHDSELSLAVVRDVLCQCGYVVEKALDVLLALSSSSNEQSTNDPNNSFSYKEDSIYSSEQSDILTDRASDCTSHSSECESQDSIWSLNYSCRNYAKVLVSSEAEPYSSTESTGSDLSQQVLESLFNISQSPEYAPNTMDWRKVAKKLQSLGPQFDVCPSSNSKAQQETYAEGEEYHALRKPANQQWESVRSCYQKAATAYSKGARQYAAYLSDQGQAQTKLARATDERASKDIFKARNKSIENVITIDLHGQHIKQAMRLLKMHLLFVSYVQTVHVLRVITGCGSHGLGKSKLKQAVIKLMDNEGIQWSEENPGIVLIKLSGQKEFSFLDSASDTD